MGLKGPCKPSDRYLRRQVRPETGRTSALNSNDVSFLRGKSTPTVRLDRAACGSSKPSGRLSLIEGGGKWSLSSAGINVSMFMSFEG